jgi:hypothetical protein
MRNYRPRHRVSPHSLARGAGGESAVRPKRLEHDFIQLP